MGSGQDPFQLRTTGLPYARLPWLAQAVKNLPAIEDPGSILELGKSPGEGNGNPLQYSFLEKSMGRGAWQSTVHAIEKRVGHD